MKGKKIFITLLTLFLFTSASYNTKAKTFGQLKEELKQEENNLGQNNQQKQLTEEQIKQVNSNITQNRKDIENITTEVKNLNDEIIKLNEEIEKKNAQIKSIINFTQLSSGDSQYLEYLFGAADFTDFIYRAAVAEQLSKYNNNLIDEYNKTIEENKKKTEELNKKQIELQNKQKELEENLNKLGKQLDTTKEEGQNIEEQIKYLKELVQVYQDRGCEDNQDISSCGRATLPTSTQFFRPIINGYVTSEFGGRGSSYHYGTDMSTSEVWSGNVNVYASGSGIVSGITWKSSCGGNMVFIHHKTKTGATYTTIYMHLYQVYVSVNQVVTPSTVIGLMGGNPRNPNAPGYTPWDSCTTGAHSHFQVATGLYGVDYSSWSTLRARSFNARNFINLPRSGWFYGRTTAY